jgi:pimeloyl-ACP methyl ester carboxylesterase
MALMTRNARFLTALVLLAPACSKPEPPPPAEPTAPVVAANIMEATDQWLTRDSIRLRYREAGQGEPVVLLHGYTQRIEMMQDIADSLDGSHRVIVLDQRGFGESTKLSDPAKYGRTYSDDVIALLDHLKIDKAHLIGHSMGATIAADVALRYPSRVESVGLVAGPFYRDSAAMVKLTQPYVASLERGDGLKSFIVWLFPGIPDSMATDFNRQVMAGNDLGSLKAVLQGMGGLTVPAGAKPDSTIRVLIAVGTGDPLLPQSRSLKRLWPSARLLEVKDVNHELIRAHGEVVAALRATIGG